MALLVVSWWALRLTLPTAFCPAQAPVWPSIMKRQMGRASIIIQQHTAQQRSNRRVLRSTGQLVVTVRFCFYLGEIQLHYQYVSIQSL